MQIDKGVKRVEQEKKIKTVIIVLAVLLALSLSALGGILIYSKSAKNASAAAAVPNNFITAGENKICPDSCETKTPVGSDIQTPNTAPKNASSLVQSAQKTDNKTKKAATVELYSKQSEENIPFKVGNMFPGDSETKYFRVRISYHDTVTVHYKAAVRQGSEKLAEVMKIKVKLLTVGETVYDGPIADMPESLTHRLSSEKLTTDELYYEITVYLDTSTGNEYQNKDLISDFKWWVEETGNLDDSPQTGDTYNTLLWATTAVCSSGIIILLIVTRKRKEEKTNA